MDFQVVHGYVPDDPDCTRQMLSITISIDYNNMQRTHLTM